MPEYLLMVLEDEDDHATRSPAVMAELIARRARFVAELRHAGQLRDHGRFRPSKEGKRVRREAGRLLIEDGPFAEAGRALSAYYWVRAGSVDEAAQLASGYPVLGSDQIDARPVLKGTADPDKEAKPGKIFGCVVLGAAATEMAWVKAMDRIDAETHAQLPAAFLGGVRLHSPTSGRWVGGRGERHAMFDGPFLETREVVGGLFFVRRTSLEDAVRWAGETPYVVHGALEIRELWRS